MSTATLAIPVLATASPPSTDLDAMVAGLPWLDGARVGTGINAVTGGLGDVAIEPPVLKDATAKRLDARYHFIRTRSEMEQEIEVTARGQYNIYGITELTGSSTYLSKVRYSELTVTLVAAQESSFADYDVADAYTLTPQAKELIKDHPERFREFYGDYFVAGRRRGSRFVAVYTCSASTHGRLDSFMASFGASAPDVFSAEGSMRFQRAAYENQVKVDVAITIEGHEGNPPPLPTTPAGVLDSLKWFSEHEKGVPLQMLLQHYGTLYPAFPARVDVDPLVFVELRSLYMMRRLVDERFASQPPVYADRFRRYVHEFDSAVMAHANVVATDAAKRRELTDEATILLRDLTQVLDRQDFYVLVREQVGSEPAEGQRIDEEQGKAHDWMYGFSSYPRSPAVQIQSRRERFKTDWHHGWRQRTLAFGPNQKYLIVGWKVTAHWTDGTDGGWAKAIRQILLTSQGAVHVKSLYQRGCDWSVTYYFVPAADYQFGDHAPAGGTAKDDDGPGYVALAADAVPTANVRVLQTGTDRVLLCAAEGEHRSLRAGEQVRVPAALPGDGSVVPGGCYTLAFATDGVEQTLEEMELVENRADAGVLVFARSPSAGRVRLPDMRLVGNDGEEMGLLPLQPLTHVLITSRTLARAPTGALLHEFGNPSQILVYDAAEEVGELVKDESYVIVADEITPRTMVYDHRMHASGGTIDVFFE